MDVLAVVPARLLLLAEAGRWDVPEGVELRRIAGTACAAISGDRDRIMEALRRAHATARGGDRRTFSCALRNVGREGARND